MMLMLDSLSSTNPSNRRAGETWIRSNLKSYPRLLDPLLFVLFDHTIVRSKSEETFHNEYFPVHYYIRNFNQAQVQYVFNTLLTVFRFGGLGFLRSIRQSTIPIDMVPIVADIVGASGMYSTEMMNVCVEVCYSQPCLSDTSYDGSYRFQDSTHILGLLCQIGTEVTIVLCGVLRTGQRQLKTSKQRLTRYFRRST